MLVLARKEGERIKIGDDIVITLVKCDHGKARIGIEAPKTLLVLREELENSEHVVKTHEDSQAAPVLHSLRDAVRERRNKDTDA